MNKRFKSEHDPAFESSSTKCDTKSIDREFHDTSKMRICGKVTELIRTIITEPQRTKNGNDAILDHIKIRDTLVGCHGVVSKLTTSDGCVRCKNRQTELDPEMVEL